MVSPTAEKRQFYVLAQWSVIIFAWDDIFDVPAEDDLMDDVNGATEVNDRMFSIFDHSETAETQDVPVVAAFREYVNPLTHQIGSVIEKMATECGLNSVPRRPRLCKSAGKTVSVHAAPLYRG